MVDKVGNITDNPTGRQVERQTGISSASSNCLKGIFAICVLIHHLYQGSGLLHDTVIGGVLQAFGYLSVACFFFISDKGKILY
jgi:peptidoglycan/LPS O-acetylase OafA/YrhL